MFKEISEHVLEHPKLAFRYNIFFQYKIIILELLNSNFKFKCLLQTSKPIYDINLQYLCYI